MRSSNLSGQLQHCYHVQYCLTNTKKSYIWSNLVASSSSSSCHVFHVCSLSRSLSRQCNLSTNYESSVPESQVSRLEFPENIVKIFRRESFPAGIYPCADSVKPHSEASQHSPVTPSPTETSLLLNHQCVPRIEENTDYNAFADNTSTVNMFWEELSVLTKYAIPNFGYAPFFFHEILPIQIFFHVTALVSLSILSS